MPRETTHGADGVVHVGWTKDLDVQLGVDRQDFEITSSNPGISTDTGLFVTVPSRRAVNKLINDLRRARDAAFGRDA